MNELFDAGHELVSRIEMFEGGSRVGADGYREWLRVATEVADYETRVDGVTEIDAERVLVILPTTSAFRSSGLRLEDQRLACVVTVRGEKIVRTEVYDSADEALGR